MQIFGKKKDPLKQIQQLEEADKKKNGEYSVDYLRRKPVYGKARETFGEFKKWQKKNNSPFKRAISWDTLNSTVENNLKDIFRKQEAAQSTVDDFTKGLNEIKNDDGSARLGLFKRKVKKTAVEKAEAAASK